MGKGGGEGGEPLSGLPGFSDALSSKVKNAKPAIFNGKSGRVNERNRNGVFTLSWNCPVTQPKGPTAEPVLSEV